MTDQANTTLDEQGDYYLQQHYEATGDETALDYTTHAISLDDRRWRNHHDQFTTANYNTQPATTSDPDDYLDLLEPKNVIRLALKSSLSDRQWWIFRLWQEGNTTRQVGEIVGIGKSTANRELIAIRSVLKATWDRHPNPQREMLEMLAEVFGWRAVRAVYG